MNKRARVLGVVGGHKTSHQERTCKVGLGFGNAYTTKQLLFAKESEYFSASSPRILPVGLRWTIHYSPCSFPLVTDTKETHGRHTHQSVLFKSFVCDSLPAPFENRPRDYLSLVEDYEGSCLTSASAIVWGWFGLHWLSMSLSHMN